MLEFFAAAEEITAEAGTSVEAVSGMLDPWLPRSRKVGRQLYGGAAG
ncbi:MAG: hypothetical protein ACRDP9_01300 [Kribbellaceae bacterium]